MKKPLPSTILLMMFNEKTKNPLVKRGFLNIL